MKLSDLILIEQQLRALSFVNAYKPEEVQKLQLMSGKAMAILIIELNKHINKEISIEVSDRS
jgi:hypothetical protein